MARKLNTEEDDGYPDRRPPKVMTDADLNRRWDPDLPKVCLWCKHWDPDVEGFNYCDAWPTGGKKIPRVIWTGGNLHITPMGGEQVDGQSGKPIVFEPHPEITKSPENAKLLNAYEAHQRSRSSSDSSST